MRRFSTPSNFKDPILTNNRGLRKRVAAIDQHFEKSKEEACQFPQVNGVIIDPTIVENKSTCPICESRETGQLFLKWGFVYMRCGQCAHVFIRNTLRKEILYSFYSQSEADKLDREVNRSVEHEAYWSQVYDKYLRYLATCNISNRNLMDVGCGAGGFLRHCSNQSDYHLHAIDFAEDTYQEMVDLIGKNNYYYNRPVESIDFGTKKFGVISLWGVLEHLAEPSITLKACREILDKSGRIIALIPNLNSRAFSILGINVPTLNPREHIQFYTAESIAQLCSNCGLKVSAYFQELPVIDLMYDNIEYDAALVDDILRHNEAYYSVYVLELASA